MTVKCERFIVFGGEVLQVIKMCQRLHCVKVFWDGVDAAASNDMTRVIFGAVPITSKKLPIRHQM